MIRFLSVLFVLLFGLQGAAFGAEDHWPHWRGPLCNGVAPSADPPVSWSEDSNIKWKIPIPGEGSATPIVWDNKIFVVTAIKVGGGEGEAEDDSGGGRARWSFTPDTPYKFDVLCIDRETGGVIWRKTATEQVPHEGHHATGTFASGSPVTDGEHLYVTFGSRGIYCYDLDGNQKWERDLGDMRTRNGFGEGASLTLRGDSLLVNWDHEGDSFLFCLDADNGETKWKTPRDEATSWTTPVLQEHGGIVQVILNGANRARAYNLENGELLWECGGQTTNPIPTALTRNGFAYIASGFRGAALYAIPLDARGDITGTDQIAWSRNEDTPYVPSPLLYDDRLYFTKGNAAILTSVDIGTGEAVFGPVRLPVNETLYASPLGAAGRIYIATRDGATMVLKHGDGFELLSVNELDAGFDASPVAVGKQLFLRGGGHLYCIENQ